MLDATFQPCRDGDLHELLAQIAQQPIETALMRATAAQRLRITSLPDSVMERVCAALQGSTQGTVRMLGDSDKTEPWKASATKIIELRNTLEMPLLVLIPSGLRTAAEDSLDIATFSELSLSDLTRRVADELVAAIPPLLQEGTRKLLEFLRLERVIRNADEEVEFLLTVRKNGATKEAVGRALFVFRLIPDDRVLDHENLPRRLSLNLRSSEELANIQRPLRERIGKLPIQAGAIQKELFSFLRSRHTDVLRQWAAEIACDPRYAHLNFSNWSINESDDQKLRLVLEQLDLPLQTPDVVGGGGADASA